MTSAFPPGRGSAVTPDERREIQCLRLVDGESVSEIARKTGRNRETIANVLRAEDTRKLQDQIETEGKEAAMRELQAARFKAARWWSVAAQHAAEKGDHRPSRDLLLHTGVIQPIDSSRMAIGVQVIVGTMEHPAGPDPFDALDVTPGSTSHDE